MTYDYDDKTLFCKHLKINCACNYQYHWIIRKYFIIACNNNFLKNYEKEFPLFGINQSHLAEIYLTHTCLKNVRGLPKSWEPLIDRKEWSPKDIKTDCYASSDSYLHQSVHAQEVL